MKCSSALFGTLVLVAIAGRAHAGGNVWTSQGPEGGNVHALAIDPHMPTTVYVATDVGVLKSTDAGATWRVTDTPRTSPNSASFTALAIDPITPTTLYAATLLIPENVREAFFEGTSDPESHLIDARESSIAVELHKCEKRTGGQP